MGEEAFGPVTVCSPKVGECQGTEVEKVIGRGSTFMETSEGGVGIGMGAKGITFQM